jgi:hypothetical protein
VALDRLAPSQVRTEVVGALGLDPCAFGLTSTEVLAAAMRRAASFLCPATPRALIAAVVEALDGLSGSSADDLRQQLEPLIEILVAYGDLMELPLDDIGGTRSHIFLGPPAFVRRSGGCLLLGVRPDGAPIVDETLLAAVESRGHLRVLQSREHAADDLLLAEGLTELSVEHWLHAPRSSSPSELVEVYATRLVSARGATEIPGLRLLDPTTSVRYYRGRWRDVRPTDTGRFVARRPQAFGSDLWCFVQLREGEVSNLIDLPITSHLKSGADEAWRLQAALDVIAGAPQRIRVSQAQSTSSKALLDLFSPVPSWCQRRLDAVATGVARSRGALVSYQIPREEVDEEIDFLKAMMWLGIEEGN